LAQGEEFDGARASSTRSLTTSTNLEALARTFLVSSRSLYYNFKSTCTIDLTNQGTKLGDSSWNGIFVANKYYCKRDGVKIRSGWSISAISLEVPRGAKN
jgi:hypothetical protein